LKSLGGKIRGGKGLLFRGGGGYDLTKKGGRKVGVLSSKEMEIPYPYLAGKERIKGVESILNHRLGGERIVETRGGGVEFYFITRERNDGGGGTEKRGT